jgi:hypothetical protein
MNKQAFLTIRVSRSTILHSGKQLIDILITLLQNKEPISPYVLRQLACAFGCLNVNLD